MRLISKDINHKNIDNKELIFKIILKNFIKLSKRQKFKYVVFKETSLGLFIEKMSKWLKDIKFIQIVRDPRDNFSSMKSGYKKYYKKTNNTNMKSVKEYYIWLNNKFYYNDSFK